MSTSVGEKLLGEDPGVDDKDHIDGITEQAAEEAFREVFTEEALVEMARRAVDNSNQE